MQYAEPYFSIVMPVYNKETHVARAIESALNQTFKDFELIIVCDPSTDNSNRVVEKFDDERVKVFYRTEPGPGGYAARNLGIAQSTGEWIAFLDADDQWLPDHLEHMHNAAKAFPDVFMIGATWQSVKGEKVVPDKYTRNHAELPSHEVTLTDYLKKGLHGARPIHTSVACVKRASPVVQNELFMIHPEVKRGGDLLAWLKMLCYHKKMAWSHHIGARYFTDADNMVTKTAPSTAYIMSPAVFNELKANLNQQEARLLQKYFNRWLRNDWKSNIHRGCANFSLGQRLYWRGDWLYAGILYITTVWPQNLRKLFGMSGRKY